jgi:hypothetical protein
MIIDSNGVKYVMMGRGTILVGSADWMIDGDLIEGAIYFISSDKRPIGTLSKGCVGKDVVDNGAEVIITFSKIEAVDLVISYLEEIKKTLRSIEENDHAI